MLKGEYKKILFEIFDILKFSEREKQEALESFKKKLAYELWGAVQKELVEKGEKLPTPPESADMRSPQILELQKKIKEHYSREELYTRSRPIFTKILEEYGEFMVRELDEETAHELREKLKNFSGA